MRKRNVVFEERFQGSPKLAHQLANDKGFQLAANSLLRGMLHRAVGKPSLPKVSFWEKFKQFGRSLKAEVIS